MIDDTFISSQHIFFSSILKVCFPTVDISVWKKSWNSWCRTAQANAGCICLWSCECCWNQAGRAIHSNLGEQSQKLKVIFCTSSSSIPFWHDTMTHFLQALASGGTVERFSKNWGSKVHLPSLCCKGVQSRSSELGILDLFKHVGNHWIP